MTRMEEPTAINAPQGSLDRKPERQIPAILTKLALIAVILGCTAVVITLLLPKPAHEGRLVGEIGAVRVFAVPTGENQEALVVWRGGRKLETLAQDSNAPVQQFDLSSADRQAAGSRHPDLVIDGWSGGMHCCLSRYVFDGPSGKLVGTISLGGSSASRFVPLNRTDRFQAAFLAFDDATLNGQAPELAAPMAQIVVVWNGSDFSLHLEAMKATTSESHAPFLLAEEFQEAQLELNSIGEIIDAASKGDLAKALDNAAMARLKLMEQAILNPSDATSFAPLYSFLNDYVYKGQAQAGFAAVRKAHAAEPKALGAALSTYAANLRQSQWFEDLDRLNDSKLHGMFDEIDRQAAPTP